MSSTFAAKAGSFERLEGAQTMRLQMMGLPDALDRPQRDADRLGDSAPGPMRHLAWRLGAGERENLGDGAGGVQRRAGRPRLVAQKPIDPLFAEALLPAPHGRPADTGPLRDLEDRQALGRQQHDARPQHVLQRTRPVVDNPGRRTRSASSSRIQTVWDMIPDSHVSPDS